VLLFSVGTKVKSHIVLFYKVFLQQRLNICLWEDVGIYCTHNRM